MPVRQIVFGLGELKTLFRCKNFSTFSFSMLKLSTFYFLTLNIFDVCRLFTLSLCCELGRWRNQPAQEEKRVLKLMLHYQPHYRSNCVLKIKLNSNEDHAINEFNVWIWSVQSIIKKINFHLSFKYSLNSYSDKR